MGAGRGSLGTSTLCAASVATSQPLHGRSQVNAINRRPALHCSGESSPPGTHAASRVFEHLRTPQNGDPALARVRCDLAQSSNSRSESPKAAAPHHADVACGWQLRHDARREQSGERESNWRAGRSSLLSAEMRATPEKCVPWESRRAGNGDLFVGGCVCSLLCVRTCMTDTHTRERLRSACLLSRSPAPWKRPLIGQNTWSAGRRAIIGRALPRSAACINLPRSRPFTWPPRHSAVLSELLSALPHHSQPALE